MKRAYSQVAWGLAFEMLDFRFGSFDLLPDVIGYLLIMVGLSRLSSGTNDRMFSIARLAAGVQFVLAVLQLFGLQIGFSLTNYEPPSAGAVALTSVSIALDLLMLYGICGGIRIVAGQWGKTDLSESARSGWSFLFWVGSLILFLFPFQLNFALQDALIFVFLLTLVYWIASLWVIRLVRRAGRELPGGGGNSDPGVGQRIDIIA